MVMVKTGGENPEQNIWETWENMAGAASLICADVTDIDTTNFRPASRYLHFKIFSWNFRI